MSDVSLSAMESTTLGQRLRHARDIAHMTQAQLAQTIAVTPGAISQWETGAVTQIAATHLRAAAAALHVSLDWLLSGTDGMHDATRGQPLPEGAADLLTLWDQLTPSQRSGELERLRLLAQHNAELLAELTPDRRR